MTLGSQPWLRIVVVATAIVFAAVVIYVFGFAFAARLHPDDTVVVLLADKVLHAHSPVVADWYYANGDIWVFSPHLLALLPVAIAGIGKATLWIALVLGFAFQLVVVAKSYGRLTSQRWVALFATLATSIAWSHSHIDFEYVQAAYGFMTCMYLFVFTQLATAIDGSEVRRRRLLVGALLVAMLAIQNPARAFVFLIVPLLAAFAWPWRGTRLRVRGALVAATLGGWLVAFVVYKLVLVRVVSFSYPAGYASFAIADAERIATNLGLLGDGLMALCGGDGSIVRALPGVAVVVGALVLVLREVLSSRERTARRFVCAVALLQLGVVLVPMVFGTLLSNETSVRYVMPSLVSLIGLAVLIAVDAIGETRAWQRRFATSWLVALPLAALAAVPDARPQGPLAELRPDAPALEPVAEVLAQRGLHRGFAVHLTASLLNIDSDGEVLACPVGLWHAIIPSRWLAGTDCFDRSKLPDRFFVVADRNDVERDAIHTTLGVEAEKLTAGPSYDIYVYNTAQTDPAWLDLPIRDGKDAVFPMHIPAKHLQLLHDKAVLTDGELVATGEEGTIVYGPYIALPRGRYDVTWTGNGIPSTGEISFAITAGGTDMLRYGTLAANKIARDRSAIEKLTFKLAATRENIELVVLSRGGAKVSLHDITIERR